MVLLLVVSHVAVFALGVLGDIYVLRFWSYTSHNAFGDGPMVLLAQRWPHYECGPTGIAMLAGGPAPESVPVTTPGTDDPVAKLGAALFDGELNLRLTTRDDKPVYVYGLDLVLFRSDPQATPEWVAQGQWGGCGDPQRRVFVADLDKSPNLVDQGVVGEKTGPLDPEVPTAALGTDFTIAADDPAHLYIRAHACRGYHEFGVKITYSFLGDTYTDLVGSPEHPFRIIGMSRPTISYVYGDGKPLRQQDTRDPSQCQPPAGPPDPSDTPSTIGFSAVMTGGWSGLLVQSDGRSTRMLVNVPQGAGPAAVEYPELGCLGTLTVRKVYGTTVDLRERIDRGPCTKSGDMVLTMRGDDRLRVTYTPEDRRYTAEALLQHR